MQFVIRQASRGHLGLRIKRQLGGGVKRRRATARVCRRECGLTGDGDVEVRFEVFHVQCKFSTSTIDGAALWALAGVAKPKDPSVAAVAPAAANPPRKRLRLRALICFSMARMLMSDSS